MRNPDSSESLSKQVLTRPLPASPASLLATLLRPFRTVVVQARVGKEFPDIRQNGREIKFIRVGGAVRTAGQLKGELTLNRGPWSSFTPRYQERDGGLAGHLLIG